MSALVSSVDRRIGSSAASDTLAYLAAPTGHGANPRSSPRRRRGSCRRTRPEAAPAPVVAGPLVSCSAQPFAASRADDLIQVGERALAREALEHERRAVAPQRWGELRLGEQAQDRRREPRGVVRRNEQPGLL